MEVRRVAEQTARRLVPATDLEDVVSEATLRTIRVPTPLGVNEISAYVPQVVRSLVADLYRRPRPILAELTPEGTLEAGGESVTPWVDFGSPCLADDSCRIIDRLRVSVRPASAAAFTIEYFARPELPDRVPVRTRRRLEAGARQIQVEIRFLFANAADLIDETVDLILTWRAHRFFPGSPSDRAAFA